MAAPRACSGGGVDSLWSSSERVRVGERLQATLAGVLELQLLRCNQLEMVEGVLTEGAEPGSAAPSRRGQADSDTTILSCQSGTEDGGSSLMDGVAHSSSVKGSSSRWSSLSWDTSSDLLSPPTLDPTGMVHLDSDSRPSSGFYSVSGSSLSDSSYSVSSDAAHGGPAPPAKPLKLWEQASMSPNNTDILWSEGATLLHQDLPEDSHEDAEATEETPATIAVDLDTSGLGFLSDLHSGLDDTMVPAVALLLNPISPTASCHLKPKLDHRFCTDLVSRRTKEVYSYPSPLHAVALQSPLFTCQNSLSSTSLSPEEHQDDEQLELNTEAAPSSPAQQAPSQVSLTHLELYISRLAHQYRGRVTSSISDLSLSATPFKVQQKGISNPVKTHGSTQSLSTYENCGTPSALQGGSFTPSKSLLGNSARISLSNAAKKGTRNSINLGNLPSATGDDVHINLNLNLNLNLTPSNSSQQLGGLQSNIPPTPNRSSFPSTTQTPALRARSRISTCPSSLCHRSSLEVPSSTGASVGFGSSAFCRSFDWSSVEPSNSEQSVFETASAPVSQRSSSVGESGSTLKLNENSSMIEEISRISGLSRAVVVGLMEQGVELDIDCFQADSSGGVRGYSKTRLTPQKDPSHEYKQLTEVSPQRPIQLSLSVTHSPQSQSSLTPPMSHSNSPVDPYHSIPNSSHHYPPHYQYNHNRSPSEVPSSTSSSPASHPIPRSYSPPRPIQPSLMGPTPLSVFRRDSPFQCSLPHGNARMSPTDHKGIQPRGGSLRQSGGGSDCGPGWLRAEGEGLYRGKHASHKLVRAATVSSYARREDYSSAWREEERARAAAVAEPRKTSKLWKGFEGRFWGRDSESEKEEMDRAEYGFSTRRSSVGSWRKGHQRMKTSSNFSEKKPKADNSPMFLKRKGREDGERRSSSLRLSRRALFRSESQGLLVPSNHEECTNRAHWVSSLDLGQGIKGNGRDHGGRRLKAKGEDKNLSSTASLFNLSRSQSLEGSCQSLSPLSSSSFSPSPPARTPLQRSRSLKDLGRKVFGSMRSLSLKKKPSKK